MTAWVPVAPGRDNLGDVARELLAIAGDPALVRTTGNGLEFLVPMWVADAFVTPPEPVAPPKKRTSRARKNEE